MSQKYHRAAVLPTEEVLPLIMGPIKAGNTERITLEGVKTHVTGLRLATFKEKGLACVTCGITGSLFALERNWSKSETYLDLPFHLNLYALKEDGSEVLMTHDHILARALGGTNSMSNSQPMCSPCNSEKSKEESSEVLLRDATKIARRDALKKATRIKVKAKAEVRKAKMLAKLKSATTPVIGVVQKEVEKPGVYLWLKTEEELRGGL